MQRDVSGWRWSLASLFFAACLALGLMASSAAGEPGVQTWTGQPGGPTPNIQVEGLTIFDANGDPLQSGAAAGTIPFTLNGTSYVGYCTDTNRLFSTATQPVEVTTQAPPAGAGERAVTWILLNRTPSGAVTPEAQQQAAASQIAVWLLLGTNISPTTPTSDDSLNGAATALVQEALAATATPASLGLSIASPAAGALSTTVTVTGSPGALVQLAASAGSLGASQVTIGSAGTAAVTLTVPGPGTVSVSASTAGDGRLLLIDPTDPQTRPQPTAAAEPTSLTAQSSVAFQAPPTPVTPTPPTTPNVPIAQTPSPRLAIAKRAPARARVLQRVRYRITVRNTGRAVARDVVLRDRLPNGMSLVRSSRRGVVRNGNLVIRLGNLPTGRSRTVTVWLRANANVRGARVNVATVSARATRPARAQARTVFRAPPRRIQPAVTG